MLVLDTNVLSAIMAPQPVAQVAAWLSAQPDDVLYTTAISQAEVLAGLAVMAGGRRRRELEAVAHAIFADDFHGRVLPFDVSAAVAHADILAARKRAGRATAPLDLMIAAVAQAQGATVVTRDIGRFEGCGVPLVNQWETS